MIGGAAIGFVFSISMATGRTHDPAVLLGMGYILGLILHWIYFAGMESSNTQGTLGKMALGIKVTDLKGSKIDFGKATGRYFGKIISALIHLIGYIMVAFTQKKQGLHDIMAGCLVVNRDFVTATSEEKSNADSIDFPINKQSGAGSTQKEISKNKKDESIFKAQISGKSAAKFAAVCGVLLGIVGILLVDAGILAGFVLYSLYSLIMKH